MKNSLFMVFLLQRFQLFMFRGCYLYWSDLPIKIDDTILLTVTGCIEYQLIG